MSPSPRWPTKYRFPLFFLLAYLLSWWALPVTRRGMLSQGVALAAVIVIALTTGKAGLREFWGRVTRFRAGAWYLAGPAIFAGGMALAVATNVLLGASVVGSLQFPVAAALLLLVFGGAWEELGWSGYALPALQERFAKAAHRALIATLVLGVLRGLWHLPLVVVGAIPWYDAVLLSPFVFQPIISWLYNRSGGSVPVVWVFHYASNLLPAIVAPLFTGADMVRFMILFYGFGFLATLVIAWRTRLGFGWRGVDDQPGRP